MSRVFLKFSKNYPSRELRLHVYYMKAKLLSETRSMPRQMTINLIHYQLVKVQFNKSSLSKEIALCNLYVDKKEFNQRQNL